VRGSAVYLDCQNPVVTDGAVHSSEVVARGTGRWATIGLVAVVAAAAGLFVGTQLDGSSPERSDPTAAAFGCGGRVTLVVDVEELDDVDYEFHSEIGPRMLPLTNDLTELLVGVHRDHQYLRPDGGRILVVTTVPDDGSAVRYEFVEVGGVVVASGTETVRPCAGR